MRAAFSKTGLKWIFLASGFVFLLYGILNKTLTIKVLQIMRPKEQFQMYDFANSTVKCSNQSGWQTLDDLFHLHKYKLQKRSRDSSITSWSVAERQPIGKYAVFSSSTRGHPNTNALYLISTALAWRRIGTDSIIIMTGNIREWEERQTLRYVINNLVFMRITLVFIQTKEHYIIMSQMARLFISSMLKWESEQNTHLITTDTDLWPLKSGVYQIPMGKNLTVLNSDCCGYFTRQSIRYKMLPISNIIMTVKTWKAVMMPYNTAPNTASDVIRYITDDLGHSRSSKLHVGRADEIVWNADQIIISMRIAEWEEKHSKKYSHYQPRWTWMDRIEKDLKLRNYLFSKDVHLPSDLFRPDNADTWRTVKELLSLMYGTQYASQWQGLWDYFQNCITMEDEQKIYKY